MEIAEKKEHILRCIKLGMDLYSSMVIATCTQDEIDALEDDEDFGSIVELHQKIEEHDLLLRHHNALIEAASKGNTRPIEWMLDKLNPDRWGNRSSIKASLTDKPNIFTLTGKITDEE